MLAKISERQARLAYVLHAEATLRPQFDPSLPGPCRRNYSTPSKRRDSPATAAATVSRPTYDVLLDSSASIAQHVFSGKSPITILPTPLPHGSTSSLNTIVFPPSSLQESLNIIEACLYNCHDVPRAQKLFETVRLKLRVGATEGLLDITLYNTFLSTFVEMASEHDVQEREKWVKEAWDMYARSFADGMSPDAVTYGTMLLIHVRFDKASTLGVPATLHSQTTDRILSEAAAKDISMSVLIERLIHLYDIQEAERMSIFKLIRQWAVNEGRHATILAELGQFTPEAEVEDPAADFPTVRPVIKPNPESVGYRSKKRSAEADEDNTHLANVLQETPFNLDTLRSNLGEVITARRILPEDAATRQKLLESSAIDAAELRMRHDAQRLEASGLTNAALAKRRSIQQWMWQWLQALVPRIEAEIEMMISEDEQPNRRKKDSPLLPFLTLLKPKKLALLTIMEVMRLQGSGGVSEGMKTARALVTVGQAVELEWGAETRKQRFSKYNKFDQYDPSETGAVGLAGIQARRMAAKEEDKHEGPRGPSWTQTVRVRVGSVLVDALMDTATITRTITDPRTGSVYSEDQPAFNHEYEYIRGKKLGVIKLNPEVAKQFAKGGSAHTLHPRHLPMLVPPRPWTGPEQGAYLYNKSSVMRIKNSQEQLQYLSDASRKGHLEMIYSGLDVLSSTPWIINRDTFKVMLDVWNSGEALGNIPPVHVDIPDPDKPDDYDTNSVSRNRYLTDVKEIIYKRRNNHSERCHVNYKLEIARAFVADKFYLPHNIDFRGRAYPIPPHLNHIGDDLSRGLLKFAETKPLGARGLRWLKIHLANVYGYDKASFDERENWTMEHLEQIYDSAIRPLDGKRWWLEADDQWQCLATCMELRAALESPDPLAFESNLPVHQDGTCNGLQHYAALGGDTAGAQQVNLAVTERPSDVYTYVANMVEQQIERDVAKGLPVAAILQGKITRKVVKQTVMTTVYGVTYIGARAQIEKQLRDRTDLDRETLWAASSYLAKTTLGSIDNLFSGAKAIQNWLHTCARLIAKSVPPTRIEDARRIDVDKGKRSLYRSTTEQMTSVIWTTPMGLPIVQPYRKLQRKQVMTGVQSVFISDPNAPSQVNPVKQSSAFPPNFIHSLDATHMMLTALECRREELTFASVHDSYWTHASSVDKMSEIIRSTFVQLHSSDVMGKLQEEFLRRYDGYAIPVNNLNEKEIARINAETQITITRRTKKGIPAEKLLETKAQEEDDATTAVEDDEDVDDEEQETSTRKRLKAERMMMDVVIKAPNNSLVQPSHSESVGADTPSKNDEESHSPIDADPAARPAYQQFVLLRAVLPTLPAKGDFSVDTIKRSLYFFS